MKVLVIIDMQNDFIDGVLGTPEAQAIVPKVIEKINATDKDTVVIFTKDTHYEDYLKTQEGELLPISHCVKGTDGWNIHKDVRAAWLHKEGACILSKEMFDIEDNNTILKEAFGSIQLGELLKQMDIMQVEIEEIELVGLCTDICVISNAMIVKAFLPDTKITVDANCCAGVTPQSHKNALDAMRACQINIKGE